MPWLELILARAPIRVAAGDDEATPSGTSNVAVRNHVHQDSLCVAMFSVKSVKPVVIQR